MLNFNDDVDAYSVSELLTICNIDDPLNKEEIIKKTNIMIDKNKRKLQVAMFFRSIQSRLMQYADSVSVEQQDDQEEDDPSEDEYGDPGEEEGDEEGFKNMSDPPVQKQTDDWFEYEALPQTNDPTQENKNTKRTQQIQVYNNEHDPMNRMHLGVNDTYQVPVKQDVLNPTLKNTISRFVNLDSQFRKYSNLSTSSNYTAELSDRIKDVLSLRVYSYQIPYTWYCIDENYGNTCLWISSQTDPALPTITVSIPSGNYTPSQFITQFSNSLTASGFSNFPTDGAIQYNSSTGKITLDLYGIVYTDGTTTFTVDDTFQVIFYDFTRSLSCSTTCSSNSNSYFNNSLGWLMGFRLPFVGITTTPNIPEATLDLIGTKYIMLVIDDFNQSQINNSLISITQSSTKLDLPNYFIPSTPHICLFPNNNNLSNLINNNDNDGLNIASKFENDYTATSIALPSAPRTLTNAQLHNINEISKNRNNNTNYLAKAPTNPEILAMLPIKTSGAQIGTLLVEFSGSLQDNIRQYFGPVNIDRMGVKLVDDKGNILNLNGANWSVTLICDCLYQY